MLVCIDTLVEFTANYAGFFNLLYIAAKVKEFYVENVNAKRCFFGGRVAGNAVPFVKALCTQQFVLYQTAHFAAALIVNGDVGNIAGVGQLVADEGKIIVAVAVG